MAQGPRQEGTLSREARLDLIPDVANPTQAPTGDDSLLDGYCDQLRATFERARTATGCRVDRTFLLAGQEVKLRFASESLTRILGPALAHLPAAAFSSGLEVMCWEGDTPEVQPPALPWGWPEEFRNAPYYHPAGHERFFASAYPESAAVVLMRTDRETAFFWTRAAAGLQTYHYASPLLRIFTAWTRPRGLVMVHAGCVGTESGAVLLVGKGGSGKSTTSLVCAEQGMAFLSDDCCLVRPGHSPTAYSLYNSGKIVRAALPLHPRLAAHAIDPHVEPDSKPVVFLNGIAGTDVRTQLPVRAILVPAITGEPETQIAPISPAGALLALAPSTLFQIQNTDRESFHAMAALVRNVPCFQLNLGTRFAGIPPAIRSLLERLP